MPKPLTDAEMVAIETGAEDTPEEAAEAAAEAASEDAQAVEDVGEETEPDDPPRPQTIPQERFDALTAENQTLRNVLTQIQTAQRPSEPATPHRRSYERPNDREDVKPWRQLIGETMEPVIQEVLTEERQRSNQRQAVVDFGQSEARARAMFSDYAKYEPHINAQLQSWIPHLTAIPPALHEIAYRTVKSAMDEAEGTRRSTASSRKRVAAGGGATSAAPAVARPRVTTSGPLTRDRIARLSEKDAFKILSQENVRVL